MSAHARRLEKFEKFAAVPLHQGARRSSPLRHVAGAGTAPRRPPPAAQAAADPKRRERELLLGLLERVKRDTALSPVRRELALTKLRAELAALDAPAAASIKGTLTIAPTRRPQPFGRSRLRRIIGDLPPVFVGDIRPLAIGAWSQLAPRVPQGRLGDARRWMSGYVNRPEYLAACAAPGAHRWNLDGTDAGEVVERHRLRAAALLENLG